MLELTIQQHCRYLNLFLGELDYKECPDKSILELTKILDKEENYYHVESNTLWRIVPWRKAYERDQALKRMMAEENIRLDERKQAYYKLAEGLGRHFKGMDNTILLRMAEKLMNDNNVGAVLFFTNNEIDLEKIPKLNRTYLNLDSGLKLTTT
jgi:hypothetical protein